MPHPQSKRTDITQWLVAGGVSIAVLAIVAALMLQRRPDFAVVLATPQDCLRAFDDATCREIVQSALRTHYRMAPQYAEEATCELAFGHGGCIEIPRELRRQGRFVPTLVAILAPGAKSRDLSGLVPLYAAQDSSRRDKGVARRVYFAGTEVGRMSSQRYGGAEITQVRDRSGQPVTRDRLEQLALKGKPR